MLLKAQGQKPRNKMADEPKPHIDMKEEAKKVEKPVETKEEKPSKVPEEKGFEEEKSEIPKEEKSKPPVKKEIPKIKKTEVSARSVSVPISTKDAKFVCRFIKNKRIGYAIRDLEQVESGKKAVPMKGEIPHRKGKRIASGRFPRKAAKHFLILLKSLSANANVGNLEEPIIVEAMANMAERPYGRFGRTQKKRTHIKIIAKEKMKKEEKK